jgi:hypothetical protein
MAESFCFVGWDDVPQVAGKGDLGDVGVASRSLFLLYLGRPSWRTFFVSVQRNSLQVAIIRIFRTFATSKQTGMKKPGFITST